MSAIKKKLHSIHLDWASEANPTPGSIDISGYIYVSRSVGILSLSRAKMRRQN